MTKAKRMAEIPDFHHATNAAGKAIGGNHIKKNAVRPLILLPNRMTPFQESNDNHAAMSVATVSATIRKRLSFDDMSAVILPLRMLLARQNGRYAHNPVLSDNALFTSTDIFTFRENALNLHGRGRTVGISPLRLSRCRSFGLRSR